MQHGVQAVHIQLLQLLGDGRQVLHHVVQFIGVQRVQAALQGVGQFVYLCAGGHDLFIGLVHVVPEQPQHHQQHYRDDDGQQHAQALVFHNAAVLLVLQFQLGFNAVQLGFQVGGVQFAVAGLVVMGIQFGHAAGQLFVHLAVQFLVHTGSPFRLAARCGCPASRTRKWSPAPRRCLRQRQSRAAVKLLW